MDFEKIKAFQEAEALKQKDAAAAKAAEENSKAIADMVRTGSFLGAKASSEVKQAVKETGDKMVSQVDEIQKTIASGQDSVAQALNNLVVATVMSRDPELVRVVKDFTSLLNNLSGATDKLGKSPLNQLPAINQKLVAALEDFGNKVSSKEEIDYSKAFDKLQKALESIDVRPVVNVAAPEVNVPAVDLSPITDALNKRNDEPLSLEDYKAQDISGDDSFQYVGFVSPNGNWYIIENDVRGGTLRYCFGVKNYMKSWANHVNQNYRLLNEAIREIQA